MAGNVKNMGLASLDDLFKSEQERQQDTHERILNIPVGEIYPYARQPYSIKRPTPDLVRLMDSIEQVGVAEPLIVRPRTEGGYEIISGHRRDYCARTVGLESLPVIIREYTDDEADILVVDYNRLLCFDIQDLGENLKPVGLLVMLDAIFNRVIRNRQQGRYTHVYIDEIYLFFSSGSGRGQSSINQYSGEFLYKCWKRFRKYGAMLTGITQNVEECLRSETAKLMFANSEFLLMFNQAATDRMELAKLLGTSDTQMDHVNNAPAGHGLIKVGGAIVPFVNDFPKDTELYRLMSTRPGEG